MLVYSDNDNLQGENQNTMGYDRMIVNGSGTSFLMAFVRSTMHCNIFRDNLFQTHNLKLQSTTTI